MGLGTALTHAFLITSKQKMAAESEGSGAASSTLKLVVFGSTGGTGKEVVTQALEQGHHVTAVVRTPGKVEKR